MGYLLTPPSVRSRKERTGRPDNRRLNSFAESIIVNVGGCQCNAGWQSTVET